MNYKKKINELRNKGFTILPNILSKKECSNYIKIFDTTLRDGEQSPGASMSLEEKIQIAEIFDEMGVDLLKPDFRLHQMVILSQLKKSLE